MSDGKWVPGWKLTPLTPKSPQGELEELHTLVGMILGTGMAGDKLVHQYAAVRYIVAELGWTIEDVRPPAADWTIENVLPPGPR
jgi:hypothetical protein